MVLSATISFFRSFFDFIQGMSYKFQQNQRQTQIKNMDNIHLGSYYTYPYNNSCMLSYYQSPINYIYYFQQLSEIVSEQLNNSNEDIKTTNIKDQDVQKSMNKDLVGQQVKVEKDIQSDLANSKRQRVGSKKIRKNIEVKYLYKNTESNISNQIFSYLLHRSKSELVLVKILQKMNEYHPEKIIVFYHYMKIIKKKIKKYLNKKSLLALCNFNDQHPSFRQISKNTKKLGILTRDQFTKILRIMVKLYLQKQCTLNLLTSKKIDNQTRRSHLERRRIIKQFLQKNWSSTF